MMEVGARHHLVSDDFEFDNPEAYARLMPTRGTLGDFETLLRATCWPSVCYKCEEVKCAVNIPQDAVCVLYSYPLNQWTVVKDSAPPTIAQEELDSYGC